MPVLTWRRRMRQAQDAMTTVLGAAVWIVTFVAGAAPAYAPGSAVHYLYNGFEIPAHVVDGKDGRFLVHPDSRPRDQEAWVTAEQLKPAPPVDTPAPPDGLHMGAPVLVRDAHN